MSNITDLINEGRTIFLASQFKQAQEKFQKAEGLIKNNKEHEEYNRLMYFQILCYYQARNWPKTLEYCEKIDVSQVDADMITYVLQANFSAYIGLKKHDKIQEFCSLLINHEYYENFKHWGYFYFGCYYNEIKKFNLAKENFEKAVNINNEKEFYSIVQSNYCYSNLHLGKYKEALEDAEIYLKNNDKHIFILMVKSEALVKLGRASEAVDSLELAKEIVETKSYDSSSLYDSELEWIEKKFSPQNVKFIDQIISASKQANSIQDSQKKQEFFSNISDALTQISDKTSISIDDLIKKRTEEMIKKTFSSDTLKLESSKISGEQLTMNPALRDYDDSFKQQATLIFIKSQMIMNGGDLKQSSPLDFGIDLLKMVPLFGSTIHSVVSGAKSFYDKAKAKAHAQAIVEFGKTVGDFESKIIRISTKVMSNPEYQSIINNKCEANISQYKASLNELKGMIESLKKSTFKVDLLDQSPQRILGAKDAEELIASYIATGYLSSHNKDSQVDKSAEFVVSTEDGRKSKTEIAKMSAEASASRTAGTSTCCTIF